MTFWFLAWLSAAIIVAVLFVAFLGRPAKREDEAIGADQEHSDHA